MVVGMEVARGNRRENVGVFFRAYNCVLHSMLKSSNEHRIYMKLDIGSCGTWFSILLL
jgi:hypothetical protein